MAVKTNYLELLYLGYTYLLSCEIELRGLSIITPEIDFFMLNNKKVLAHSI
jgi:hypothetical protein